jgi:hypothetical protein
MKKQLFNALLCSFLAIPFISSLADTVVDGQSTEGKDFWATFMRADQNDHSDASDKAITLALTVSAKEECDVTFTNPITGETHSEHLGAGAIKEVSFYTGDGSETARTRTDAKKAIITCYTFYPDSVDNSAIHVESTGTISLFASNRREKSFDATNVLPTVSLLDEYLIQAVPPSDHGDSPQGTHFCIIATEDNTIVDYCPTVETTAIRAAKKKKDWDPEGLTPEEEKFANWKIGDTLHTPILNKGQVYYIWTGNYSGSSADISGTWLKARASKKIAVFQGAPHTNLPDKIRDRDHLFSQAMPVAYWGNTFVITASLTRGRDIIRVMAREDGTNVYINGDSVYTFDFSTNPKRTFEFEIGKKGVQCTDKNHKGTLPDPLVADSSCYITTSCPAATHLFMVSNTYDDNPVGDPAMVWVNPIEQRINDITFATYGSSNTHYFNVVTDQAGVASMKLDGNSIAVEFRPVTGSNNQWYYARKNISYATHHLTGDNGFIAHVYGYGDKESYGYSAGGATKPLTQYITINGEIFTPDKENTLCGEDTVKFACHPDYVFNKLKWNFGDGVSKEFTYEQVQGADSVVPHYYQTSGVYQAYVLIYRESSNVCVGQNAIDSIPITVTIGRYIFEIGEVDVPCPEDGTQLIGKIYYKNEGKVNLHGDNVVIKFNDAAKADGFKDEELIITDQYFQITIPNTAQTATLYGIDLKITSDCGGADTTLNFMLNYDKDVISQRYNNVLGLLADPFAGKTLSDFQWYRTSDSTAVEGQISANLNFYDLPENEYSDDTYYICFTINKGQIDEVKTCACAKAFVTSSDKYNFGSDDDLIISATYVVAGDRIFVNADWEGKTDLKCFAQWINASGKVVQDMQFDIPDGGCTIPVPNENGLYLLRVTTGKHNRSFKFIINK